MDAVTPRWKLPRMREGCARNEHTHNEALAIVDQVLHGSVKSWSPLGPPTNPTEGDRYIVSPAAAYEAWTGHEGDIATWTATGTATGWVFITPQEGMRVFLEDEDAIVTYKGFWSMGSLPLLTQTISETYQQGEIQAIQTAVNSIITVLRERLIFKNK